MAWDRRGYFYFSYRVGQKVRRLYFGKGPIAEAAALVAGQAAGPRTDDRRAKAARRDALDAADRAYRLFARAVDGVVAGRMAAAGYHRHDRGPWQKRRAGPADSGPAASPPPAVAADPAAANELGRAAVAAWADAVASMTGGDPAGTRGRLDAAAAGFVRDGADDLGRLLSTRSALSAARAENYRLAFNRSPAGAVGDLETRAARAEREDKAAARAADAVRQLLRRG